MTAEREERLRRLVDVVPVVVWVTALNPEHVQYVSPAFERGWGVPAEALYRNPRCWTDTIHPEDRPRVIERFSRWIAGEDVSYDEVEYRIVQPGGAIRWIHDRGVLFRDENGQPREVSGIATAITERKPPTHALECAFEQIQLLKEQLEQENIALREEVDRSEEHTSELQSRFGISY